ncbi:MAG: rhomboid family intramembrane serine protease [Candidatus Portiera sp.]|nr:rhomboid family intramembrane serine protease [Portiera sp.]
MAKISPSLGRGASKIGIIYALIAVNLAVYLWIYYLQDIQGLRLGCFGGLQAYKIIGEGEYWRIFSSMFVHYDFAHLAFNMAALFIFGSYATEIFGWLGAVIIYLICGIFANLVALLIVYPAIYSGVDLGYCAIGASGSVLGLVAAVGFFMWQVWRKTRHPRAYAFARQFAIILLLQFAIDIFAPNVSQVHHLSGALSGVIIAYLIAQFPQAFKLLLNKSR